MTIYKQVPIEEELPPNNKWVFVKTKDHDEMLAKYYYGQWRLFYKEGELEIMETDEILFWLKETSLPIEEEIIQKVVDYIGNDSEIAIPIEFFFDENGEGITKKQYGIVLLKILCQELTDKFITKKSQK